MYYPSYQGISNICQFTSAGNYTFAQPSSVNVANSSSNNLLFYDKGSGCSKGILPFKQGNYYGAIDFEDISGYQLNYRYWYDESGSSNFSSLCSSSNVAKSSLASLLDVLSEKLTILKGLLGQ